MAVTSTTRFGLTQWSSGTDPFTRAQLSDSLLYVDSQAAGFLVDVVRPAAGNDTKGFFHYDSSTEILSFCDGTEWVDFSGEGLFGTPGSIAIGDGASEGSAGTYARSDHRHEAPSFSDDTPAQIGSSGAKGVAATLSRSDHRHSIGTGAINLPGMFAAGAVDALALASDAVTTDKILASAVTEAKLATGAVTETKIGGGAVTEAKLGNSAVTESKLYAGAVSNTKLADSAVTTAKLQNDAVTTTKIADDQVTGDKIAHLTVAAINLATNAVTSIKIEDGAVSNTKVQDGAITAGKIGAGEVTNAKLASGIDVGKITGGENTLDPARGPLKAKTTFDGVTRESTLFIDSQAPSPSDGEDYDLWFMYTL